MVVSLHQYYQTTERVIRIDRNGEASPFPNAEMSSCMDEDLERCGEALDSVMGICASGHGIIWMLDNGRRGETLPKVVAWNTNTSSVHRIVYLPEPATTENSFLADLVVDPDNRFLYIADPASGMDAALIVVDLKTGLSRRVLESHISVVPEDVPLVVQGQRIEVRRADGSSAEPLAGVNPIAVDRKGRYLYYGPMKGRRLYRIDIDHLKDSSMGRDELGMAVELYSFKPVCDSIAIDQRNNIYAADLTQQAISIIPPDGKTAKDRRPQIYIHDPQLAWPDGLTFGNDQRLYFFCSQINRTSWFNGGQDATQGPFRVYRVKPLHQPLLASPISRRMPLSELGDQLSERFGKE